MPTEAELLEMAQDKENMVMVTKFKGNDVDFPKVNFAIPRGRSASLVVLAPLLTVPSLP